ncbi:homoserine kinase [Fulvitalea axinellae]|uniref:homoserine kinase n=1 Tax=Fulvitalea axinellae TaxID=1182444 RepID=UPI0030CA1B70
MDYIKVFAPATVANVACGFDVLGFAIDSPGDEVELTKSDTGEVRITKIIGDGGKLPTDADKNTAGVVVKAFLEAIGSKQGIDIVLHKHMPLGSGMGSSAASSAAAVYAANKLMGSPLSDLEILPFAMEGERIACGSAHADNVAPSLLGGFTLIRSYSPLDVVKIDVPDELFATVVHPKIVVNTKDARKILKGQVPLDKAIRQWGNVGALIAGLLQKDYGLISRSLEDVIIEPVRSLLLPGFDEAKQAALEAGALGFGISGSGPSLFSLNRGKKTAETVAHAIKSVYDGLGIETDLFVSAVNQQGPSIIRSNESDSAKTI